jgi:hypothetical protein
MLVSSPRYREEIDYEGIESAVGKFQMGSSHPHSQSKLEEIKISRKLFGQLNKLQGNNLAGVIAGDETSVYFENSRSAMWAGADVRRSTRGK